MLEEFEDTKWIIRICKSKKYTQHSFFTGCFLVLWRFFMNTWVLIDNVLFLLVPIYFAVLLHHLCNKTGKKLLKSVLSRHSNSFPINVLSFPHVYYKSLVSGHMQDYTYGFLFLQLVNTFKYGFVHKIDIPPYDNTFSFNLFMLCISAGWRLLFSFLQYGLSRYFLLVWYIP
jgi:hypothetical protein